MWDINVIKQFKGIRFSFEKPVWASINQDRAAGSQIYDMNQLNPTHLLPRINWTFGLPNPHRVTGAQLKTRLFVYSVEEIQLWRANPEYTSNAPNWP